MLLERKKSRRIWPRQISHILPKRGYRRKVQCIWPAKYGIPRLC